MVIASGTRMLHCTHHPLTEQNSKGFRFQGTDRNGCTFTIILCQTGEPTYRIAAGVEEPHRNGCRSSERVEISTSVN
jgi:hypothetical protein